MPKAPDQDLSRRERQIMHVLYRREHATVAEIAGEMPEPPSDTAIRTHLRILEEKGHVRRQRQGKKHVYRPRVSRQRAARAALSGLLSTYFDGSLGDAVAMHLADPRASINDAELERLRELIRSATKEQT